MNFRRPCILVSRGLAARLKPHTRGETNTMKISRILTGLLPVLALLFAMSHPVVTAADDVPTVGTVAPDFTLSSQEGKKVSLHDYKGQWVVLYFYPKDMTPGCTIEAHNFQRDQADFDKKNAVIVGVRLETAHSHVQFCTKEHYGSLVACEQMQVANHNTFLIDHKGIIRKVYLKVDPNPHSKEVLAAL